MRKPTENEILWSPSNCAGAIGLGFRVQGLRSLSVGFRGTFVENLLLLQNPYLSRSHAFFDLASIDLERPSHLLPSYPRTPKHFSVFHFL